MEDNLQEVEEQQVDQEVDVEQTEQSGGTDWEAEAKKFQSLADKRDVSYKETKQQLDQWNSILEQDPEMTDYIKQRLAGEPNQEPTSSDDYDPYDVKSVAKLVNESVQKAISPVVQKMENAEQQRAQQLREREIRSELNGLGLKGERQDAFLEFISQPKEQFSTADMVRVFNTLNPHNSDIGDVKQTQQSPPSAGAAYEGGQAPQKSEMDKIWEGIKQVDDQGKIF